ncbi:divalent-cation tolerance protein CutA [bacterium]|nr:divalent-cation tolerance protein CutA [bacterium]
MDNKYCAVLVTTESAEAAKGIAMHLLRRRLAVCVNIVPRMTSMYWWHDKIEECKETFLLIKTRSEKFEELEAEIKKLHSYEVPEILSVPIGGNADYLAWIDGCLSGSPE